MRPNDLPMLGMEKEPGNSGSSYHYHTTPRVVCCKYSAMIRSCKDKETQKLLNRVPSRKFKNIETAARVKLALVDSATSLSDLSLPGLRLEKLLGDRAGQYSIRINDQFRICFRWRDGDAYDVEITDYH